MGVRGTCRKGLIPSPIPFPPGRRGAKAWRWGITEVQLAMSSNADKGDAHGLKNACRKRLLVRFWGCP